MARNKRRNPVKKKKNPLSCYTVEHEETLLVSLISHFPGKNRKLIKAVLKAGQVVVENKSITQFDHILKTGQNVEVDWERKIIQNHPPELNIVHMDQHIIIVNKPAGLLTVATEKEKRMTVYSMLSKYVKTEDPDNRIFIIHRIDRETSGLIMFARSEEVKINMQQSWTTSIDQRTYVGLVEGNTPDYGTINSWLSESKAYKVYSSQNPQNGRKSVTHYKKIRGNGKVSLVKINLETGRKHQIRVHMQDIGHPVVGDKKYGSTVNPIGRMGLHAQVLAFTHPVTGKSCHFDSGIPATFLKPFGSGDKQQNTQNSK